MPSSLLPVSTPVTNQGRIGVERRGLIAAAALLVGFTFEASGQTLEVRQWQGTSAMTRQPEQVIANNTAEWRSLWSRVGSKPPDVFEPGRTSAVGIFLGSRAGEGYAVNVISTTRRRDRIMVVFEERAPTESVVAQRSLATPRPINGGGAALAAPSSTFAPSSGNVANLPAPASRNLKTQTSPWAIVLIQRADMPVTVEQRLFR